MGEQKYDRGSVWRKWDLQVQTILDDNYVSLGEYHNELKQNNPTAWQEYISKVGGEENALLFDTKAYFHGQTIEKRTRCYNYVRNLFAFLETFQPDIECLGITDHNYYDEYLLDALISYAKGNRLKIIPGVEINCQGIHMLLFFPDNLYAKQTFSAGIQTFLIKFDINNAKNESGTLTTTSVDIKEIIDEAKRNDGIIVYPHCNSDNGLFQGRTKTDRTHLANIFNHQEMNLLQAQEYQSCKEIQEYIESNKNLLSKCSHHISSDSRCLKDIGKCDKAGNYFWIKANPTFEGLKQIIYEPTDRIYVGTERPEQKKTYFLIDTVKFLDNSGSRDFTTESIKINQNLTTIIGGKSTGKSLLLHYIAKTIDRDEVENRKASNRSEAEYDFDKNSNFDFEVTWRDGYSNGLKESSQDNSQKRKILYIPQRYLNSLSESGIKNRQALNDFVMKVILQDREAKGIYDQRLSELASLSKSIPITINELFSDKAEVAKIEQQIKQIGDEKGIAKYIEQLQTQVDDIKTKSGLESDEIDQYEKLTKEQKDLGSKITNLEEDNRTIGSLKTDLKSHAQAILDAIQESEGYLNDSGVKLLYQTELKIAKSLGPAIETASINLTAAISNKIKEHTDKLNELKADLAPLLAKVQMQTELETKSEAIKKEQQKLTDIGIKKKTIGVKKDLYEKKITSLIDTYKKILEEFESIKKDFIAFEDKFGDIALSVLVGFNENSFNLQVVNDFLNKKDLKKAIADNEWNDEFFYRYDSGKHVENITAIINGLLNGTIKTIKNRLVKDALTKLLENYFYIDFKIFYKKDPFEKMSPGKKGLVLLQLLINLSNEEWPILLDQPEDDLDNRSIYEDLVEFLKRKKIERQIVIVTHNPNLAVGADAEETIVANQSGQEIGRDNKKYRFEYVSGALEDAFELTEKQELAILYRKGIRQHVCEILEGGEEAFQKRERKYNLRIRN